MAIRSILNLPILRSFFKVASRGLLKNRSSALINIGGLTVGMAVAMLIGLWIHDELSYNKYHKNYNRIGMLLQQETWDGKTETHDNQSFPMGTLLRSSFKDDFTYAVLSSGSLDHILSVGDKKFTQKGNFMQPEAPDMLTLKMISGTRAGLKEINSILLSESVARRLFGNIDAEGKALKLDNKTDCLVTGVYEDLPGNDFFSDLGFIATWDSFVANNAWVQRNRDDWGSYSFNLFVQLARNSPSPADDFARVNAKIKKLPIPHLSGGEVAANPVVIVNPMSKWHLFSKFENGVRVTSDELRYCWFYGLIGIFVLLLACINFMNLSTARSEKRAKEVGIRKAIGSLRLQLMGQFFSESLLVSTLSFIFAIALTWLAMPWFNSVAGKTMSIPFTSPLFWLAGLAFSILTGLLAGSYPALYLSSFKPVKVLKGNFRAGRYSALPRKVLVTLQFTVSIALIIGTFVVYRQIQYAQDRPVGYSSNGLITLQMVSPTFTGKFQTLRNELKNTGAVAEVAETDNALTEIGSNQGIGAFTWRDKPNGMTGDLNYVTASRDYGNTIGWKLLAGTDFPALPEKDSSGLIINEAAAKLMNLPNPVGETVHWQNTWVGGNYKIIGVTKDMIMKSPYEPAPPTLFFLKGDINWLLIKINPSVSATAALSKIEATIKKIVPDAPFDYHFADEQYGEKFAAEKRIGTLAAVFAVLAVFISCLGLFGLASFVAEQRAREIGVRKILGASVPSLWALLSRQFVVLVLVSCGIAIPLAAIFLHGWLQQYTYRAALSWWIFAGAAAATLLVTLLTVSYQAIRAALVSPGKTLRTE